MAAKFNKKPVTGMKDILPAEMQIRDYVMNLIKETYRGFGFTQIETPCFESIGNLSSNQGGENEKLIFKVLKRGEKLNLETAETEADLVDSGLRYDLTMPLSRFYSNNAANLPKPFKALQIGPVWRADRPQKGRFRQFYQCDIDILGDASNMAEIELILADQFDQVFIILDKMDKIGIEGVAAELQESGFAEEAVAKYCALFEKLQETDDGLAYLSETLAGEIEDAADQNLSEIINSVKDVSSADCRLQFDPTLVRGMSYYTGTIFEITMDGFPGSVAGGGRYDKMIGKFTGNETCACGFSIGFERIVTILLDENFQIPGAAAKKAYLVEKGMPAERLCEVLKEAQAERAAGMQILVSVMNKNKKFQKEQLEKEGYHEFREFYRNPLN